MAKQLNDTRVAILATDGFEQVELERPRAELDLLGADTRIIAPKRGTIQGFHHDEKGDRFKVDLTLEEADSDEFEAVLLPGGLSNADMLRVEPAAKRFVQRTDDVGKPIAVICHGAWLLVSAGLVLGRTMTSFHTIRDDIRNAGGDWIDEEVAVDGNWVSSRKPDDITAFNREMTSLFAEMRARAYA